MHEKSPWAAGLNKFCAWNDKIRVVASVGLPDGYHMHRNTIQITCWRASVDEADSAALATEAGKNANSLTWLKEPRPLPA